MSSILADHGSVGSAGPDQTIEIGSDCQYCYMFPELAEAEALRPKNECRAYFEKLDVLARLMDQQARDARSNSKLPAIYTYFGQFINHDLSAATATPLYWKAISNQAAQTASADEVVKGGPDAVALMTSERPPNPQWLVSNILNQHPEPLCLYSLYGTGPSSKNEDIKKLYDLDTMKFRLGKTFDDPEPQHRRSELDKMLRHDLVRDPQAGLARIADQRNDENVIISQLHLAFMLFHNQTIEALKDKFSDPALLFKNARALVTQHYQYCIANDYLKELVPDEQAGSQIHLTARGSVPFEFTTAAFRFGHSMISAIYNYNCFFGDGANEGRPATLRNLFEFTSHGKMAHAIGGGGQLPTQWVIDWARFLHVADTPSSGADHIDLTLPTTMVALSDVHGQKIMLKGLSSISHRNIKRGYHRFMPSGQELALRLGITPLTPMQIKSAFPHPSAAEILDDTGFDITTPAWVYFLCEAKLMGGGNILGPTAGAIVRGTIMELLRLNPDSVLCCDGGGWTPQKSPLRTADGSTIKNIKTFLQFAGVLS